MTERPSRDQEDQAENLLAGRDARLVPPGFAEVRRRARRRPGVSVLVQGGLALVALGVVAAVGSSLLAYRAELANAAASGRPTAVSGPAPSASSGFLVAQAADQVGIRSETSADILRSITARRYSVSPDGRQVAYWQTGPEDALPHRLHVLNLGTGDDAVVLTLESERAGSAGWIIWAPDGRGLAIAVHDGNSAFEGRFAPRVPAYSTIRLLDLGSKQVVEVLRASGGWLVPIAWDREHGRVSAITRDTNDLALSYLVRDVAAPSQRQIDLPVKVVASSVQSDDRGTDVLGIERTPCGIGTCGNVWVWSASDPSSPHRASRVGGNAVMASFRPTSTDVFVLLRDAPTMSVIERWAVTDTSPREVARLSQVVARMLFRVDGSALTVTVTNLNQRSAVLIDPASGRTVALPAPAELLASIQLQ